MRLLVLPVVWAGLRAARVPSALLRGGTRVIPCATPECHEDNRLAREREQAPAWHHPVDHTVSAAPPVSASNTSGASLPSGASDTALSATGQVTLDSPCNDATGRTDLAESSKMDLLSANDKLTDQAKYLVQRVQDLRNKKMTLQAAAQRINTTNSAQSNWCASRAAQMGAHDAWFEAHLAAVKGRCERGEDMSAPEFQEQIRAITDAFNAAAFDPIDGVPAGAAQALPTDLTKVVNELGSPELPGLLKTHHDSKCLDYDPGSENVYMYDCHSQPNQMWYIDHDSMHTKHDGKCLDYNYDNQNVYMHDCHGGANQQWYIDGSGMLKTKQNNNCLDYNYHDGNVYMTECHGESNQQWFFE